MDIKRLPEGEIAPSKGDCIRITKLDDGRFALATSALAQSGDGEELSEAILSGDAYESCEEAEAAGLAWARVRGVATVYIETT